ncbi:MAG: hypothetical protein HY815_24390 [Candidatus Riflebacteria bacterium]|nr:hypothetical protein [Candidatus Riflebacteria bacterium]
MEILDSPLLLALTVVLSAVSFVLVTAGLKTRNLVWALYGVAFGTPTIAITTPEFWALGVLFGLAAYWVSRYA